ncbi:hypothetical protein [Microbacterium sp. NPDC076911]|uniref:hypothetical protein n=1 Tax=Microbacterium sp. NPDC076911 TaxID=3154958 RepID=UPI003419CC57
MPRSNRRRPDPGGDDSFQRMLSGWKRTETKRGSEWIVQPVSAQKAQKIYACPGCGRGIQVAEAHIVAWRADGVLGDKADLDARRHWHSACWRIN